MLLLHQILTHARGYSVGGGGGTECIVVGSGGENRKIPRFDCKVLAAVQDSSGLSGQLCPALLWNPFACTDPGACRVPPDVSQFRALTLPASL